MERKRILIVIGSSLILLFAGLAFFDSTIGGPRYRRNQVVHLQANSPILNFHARVHRIEPDGSVFLRDYTGAIIRADLKGGNLHKDQIILLNGTLVNSGLFHVTLMEAFPLRFWKFSLSILGLLFVIWNLYRSLEWTSHGLRFKKPDNEPI